MAPRQRKSGTVPPQSVFSRVSHFGPTSLDVGGRAQRCALSGRGQTTAGQDHERDDFILRGPAVGKGDHGFIDIKPSVLRAEALLHTDLQEPQDNAAADEEIARLTAKVEWYQAALANLLSGLQQAAGTDRGKHD